MGTDGARGRRLKASLRKSSERECCVRSQGSESSEEVKVRCLLGLLLFRFNFNFFATNIQMDCYYPTHIYNYHP